MSSTPVEADSPSAASYWNQARLPLASLCFVTPLLLVYEGGLLLLGPEAMRNGADVWLRNWLGWLGLGQYLLLPLLTVFTLLVWHFLERQRWRFSWPVLCGMLGESLLLAGLLWTAGWFRHRIGLALPLWADSPALVDARRVFQELVVYLGAGIYEELLFRLLLLPLLAGALVQAGLSRRASLGWAIAATSAAFSAAHHLPGGEPFAFDPFLFRLLAGAFFAAVFVGRGFGIAVGAHTAYDVLAAATG